MNLGQEYFHNNHKLNPGNMYSYNQNYPNYSNTNNNTNISHGMNNNNMNQSNSNNGNFYNNQNRNHQYFNNIEKSNGFSGNSKDSTNPNNNINSDFRKFVGLNEEMNSIVRDTVKSRGNHSDIKQEEMIKKKILLENIQQQIVLKKENMQKIKKDKIKEEQNYLNDIATSYPFGRSGAGAPNRDREGNILTNRRRLISDPKYQHFNINVNDDYDEVWNNKKPGILRFINSPDKSGKKQSNDQHNNQNNETNFPDNNQNNQQFYNRINLNQHNNPYNVETNRNNFNNNNNSYPYTNIQNKSNEFNSNYHQNDYNNFGMNSNFSNNNNLNTNDYNNRNYQQEIKNNTDTYSNNYQDYNYNDQNENKYFQNNNQIDNNFNSNINKNMSSMPIPNTYEISLSYGNNEIDPDIRRNNTLNYRGFLLNQMREKEEKKKRDLEKKKQEELEEDERIRREKKELEARLYEEELKKKRLKESIDMENKRLRDLAFNQNRPNSKKVEFNIKENPIQDEKPSVVVYNPKEDDDLKKAINDQILRLKNQINDQQMQLISNISELKNETQQANLQRYEALKEIAYLKDEISKSRIEDELRRKYVYDVMVDNKNTLDTVMNNSKQEPLEKIDIFNNHKKNVKNLMYDDMIRFPNRPQLAPKLVEDGDMDIGGKSSFIDIDTYKVNKDQSTYEPAIISNNADKYEQDEINSRGIKLNDDYIPIEEGSMSMRNYSINREKDFKEIPNFKNNLDKKYVSNNNSNNNQYTNEENNNELNSNTNTAMDVNSIYNRNLERLRWLNNIDHIT